MNKGYLRTKVKKECFGCESCVQICPKNAISIITDEEGFRYPNISAELCVSCGLCNKVCPYENMPPECIGDKYVFGGYIQDDTVRDESTSGGAFSAIVDIWCDNNYVVFGAETKGLKIQHSYVENKNDISKFRRSKYSQSNIGNSYKYAKQFLNNGKKVLFSGTPCQIAGLKAYLGDFKAENLLTVEVICEGVPSPLYIDKLSEYVKTKYGNQIEDIDYRYKDKNKWDFQVMQLNLGNKKVKKDRWFNPFWSIWLKHLMSRPSCYDCPFAKQERQADISLGDLWGVHLYCPELYGNNKGSSLAICNSDKGKIVMKNAEKQMFGHELEFGTALKYQGPLRKAIGDNPNRETFMKDLISDMSYKDIVKKWATPISPKLIYQKYIWGNRQKVAVWNLMHK